VRNTFNIGYCLFLLTGFVCTFLYIKRCIRLDIYLAQVTHDAFFTQDDWVLCLIPAVFGVTFLAMAVLTILEWRAGKGARG